MRKKTGRPGLSAAEYASRAGYKKASDTGGGAMKIPEADKLNSALCAWRSASQDMRFAWYDSTGARFAEGDAFYAALIEKHRRLEEVDCD